MTSRTTPVVRARCGITDCPSDAHARGMCQRHYMQWYNDKLDPPSRSRWEGEELGAHRDCGGRLIGIFCVDRNNPAARHPLAVNRLQWAECDRCGLRGEPVGDLS